MIDRRVQVISGSEGGRTMKRVSELRETPCLVLLGEPGIGKTTVMETEAAAECVQVLKVREVVNGTAAAPGDTLFLDALDEYRSGGTDLDKIFTLAAALQKAAAPRWRLACRSEDWQKEADLGAIGRTASGPPIVVAQLLPLEQDEAIEVLIKLGEQDPEAFVAKAIALGATGLLQSPLSLKLLRSAITSGGSWPKSRFALFANATRHLAHEGNVTHKLRRDRSSATRILEGADRVGLYLLVTGSRVVWRSNDLPPFDADARAFLPDSDLQLDTDLIDDMLDTALFRGEGEAFEPMHRTVAEFLGGRALAQMVVGSEAAAALPLSRALALITGRDGRPPSELRGLFAWFAAHLAEQGEHEKAVRLAEIDAVGILAYGDAAAFSTAGKRAIFAHLDRQDPYFRASEVGVTAVGGLACEELAEDFAIVLASPDDSHLMLTVMEVLTTGPPVPSLRPLTRAIALDPKRPEWQRWRAADAWLNGADDRDARRRELFDALATEPVTNAREALRGHLAVSLPTGTLSLDDVKSMLADFVRAPDNNTIMRLWGLQRRLEADPPPGLFDEAHDWLPDEPSRHNSHEVETLLDHVLAAAIKAEADLDAERLWRWTVNARGDIWSSLGPESARAVGSWIDAADGRDVALFEAILEGDDADNGPWVVGTNYTIVAQRPASILVAEDVLNRAAAASGAYSRRLFEIAVELVRRQDSDFAAFWAVYDALTSRTKVDEGLVRRLTVINIEPWRLKEQDRARKRRRTALFQRTQNVQALAPILDDLRTASRTHPLNWAAEKYFLPSDKRGQERSGIERIADATDDATTDAILDGWRYLATVDVTGLDPAKLGAVEASGERYDVEWPAVAGLHVLLAKGQMRDPATMPLTLAIVVLRSGSIARMKTTDTDLRRWAYERLNLHPPTGASALYDFWIAALDAGGARPSSIWNIGDDDAGGLAVTQALETVLDARPGMRADALKVLLATGAKRLSHAVLDRLASKALADPVVMGKQRAIWSFVGYALDPTGRSALLKGHAIDDLLDLVEDYGGGGVLEAFGVSHGTSRAHQDATVVGLLAPVGGPEEEEKAEGMLRRPHRLSEAVSRAIKRLSLMSDNQAGDLLSELLANSESYPAWVPSLRHAQAQHTRARRDREFVPLTASAVTASLSGRAPANASDLRAVVVEELTQLGRELRTGANTPWKRFWNLDSDGAPVDPLIENQCRDHVLDRLQDRLTPYRIAASMAEVRRGNETRADIIILSGAGRNLPVEAKRHWNSELWTAPATQLQGYASDEKADGYGVYLVFWFGSEWTPTPLRPSGGAKPTTPSELKAMLEEDLPFALQPYTDVVVFDVSPPGPVTTKKARRRATTKKPPKGKATASAQPT